MRDAQHNLLVCAQHSIVPGRVTDRSRLGTAAEAQPASFMGSWEAKSKPQIIISAIKANAAIIPSRRIRSDAGGRVPRRKRGQPAAADAGAVTPPIALCCQAPERCGPWA